MSPLLSLPRAPLRATAHHLSVLCSPSQQRVSRHHCAPRGEAITTLPTPETARSHHQPPSSPPPSQTPLIFGAYHPLHRHCTNKGVTANILPQQRRHSRSLPLVPTPTPSPPARNHRNRAIVPLFLLLLRVIAHLLPPLPHCRR
ncbi:hypothetical protein B296_00037004 [Ensete ventricosum]|uniref:Uncharacterized protein n=1 Tax=Ensete ventricosum TaxID=4639 RepID=A0A426ZPR0_ENSVE|nr:hypothetical protein B296_00037004 [Ensete ventricosum]